VKENKAVNCTFQCITVKKPLKTCCFPHISTGRK